MSDYALNDRGSLEVVTDDYYDTEIMRLFEGLRFDREQMVDAQARLVPEPDNPRFPRSIAVKVGDLKIGRLSDEDSARYWNPIARVVASGYSPLVPVRVWATMQRPNNRARLESRALLSIARPDMLFPMNAMPVRAALLPQGPTLKVLDEKDHADYLHGVLPESGEGRLVLTLENNHLRLPDGTEVDSVDVLHDRRVVGRLSTQMSAQLAPVIRHAFDHDKLTAAWGSILGNAFELSLSVQAARAADIPASWFEELPNSLPQLIDPQEDYELAPAYEPSNAEEHPENRRGADEESARAVDPGAPRKVRRRAEPAPQKLGWALAALGALIVVVGVFAGLIAGRPVLSVLGLLLGGAVAFWGLYQARFDAPADFTEADGVQVVAHEPAPAEGRTTGR